MTLDTKALKRTHNLKTWPEPFQAVLDGRKTHEIRVNDRDYKAGDRLCLQEYLPEDSRFTGREIVLDVPYVTPGGNWGLPAEICVMSIRRAALPADGWAGELLDWAMFLETYEGHGCPPKTPEAKVALLRAAAAALQVREWQPIRDAKATLEFYATMTGDIGQPARDALSALKRNYGL